MRHVCSPPSKKPEINHAFNSDRGLDLLRAKPRAIRATVESAKLKN
jgi:hypothetical protein